MAGAARTGDAAPRWLADGVAGVSMAGLLLPEAVAYSGIAGAPPQAGVVALFAGLAIYGLLGRSRYAIVSATSSSAAVMGAATLSIAGGDALLRAALASGLVMVTGAAFLLAGAARMGSICDFVAKPVLRGFSFGLALSIVVRQMTTFTGVSAHAEWLPAFAYELLSQRAHWNWAALSTGVAALAALKAAARLPRLPGALLVIAAGIIAAQVFDLRSRGVAGVGVIELHVAAPTWPMLTQAQWLALAELSLALFLLLFAESYGAIRSMALKHGDAIAPNRDLAALGAANLVSGLLHGLPVGAGFSATSANEAAGAASRRAAWIAAAAVLLLLLLFLPAIALTPAPVLAAVVIHAVSHTLTPAAFVPYFRWRRDRVAVVAAALAVVLFGVLNGLLAGIAVSLAMTLRALSQPRVSELGRVGDGHDFLNRAMHADARPVPGVLVLRPEAPLFFANVERVLAEVRGRLAAARARALVLSLEETPDVDGTVIEALDAFMHEQARAGVALALARLKDPVLAALEAVPNESAAALLLAGSVDDAVAAMTIGQGRRPSA